MSNENVIGKMEFEIVKNVTKPFFVVPEDGTPMYLKFLTPFVLDDTIQVRTRTTKNEDGTEKKKEPLKVADVVNLQTGEEGRIIGNSVMISELEKCYPEQGYASRYFQITQGAMKTGKTNKYRTFKIVEIKLREPEATGKGKK